MHKLGFGLMRLPILDPNDRSSVDVSLVTKMIDYFLQHDGRHFDTGYFYHGGRSETIFGELVSKRYPRERYSVTAKLPIHRIKAVSELESIFGEQLAKCGVDHFDYYMLHGIGRRVNPRILQLDAFGFLEQIKARGQANRIGFSYHDDAVFLEDILSKYPEIDVVQLQLNYADWENAGIQSKKCYYVCEKYGVDVIVMEPLKGGALLRLSEDVKNVLSCAAEDRSMAAWGLGFAFSLPQVRYVLSGMSSLEQIQENIAYAQTSTPFREQDYLALQKAVSIINSHSSIECTACYYCNGVCPQKIPIPELIALYNDQNNLGFRPSHRITFQNIVDERCSPANCIQCGRCEDICPQKLPVHKVMNELYSVFVK